MNMKSIYWPNFLNSVGEVDDMWNNFMQIVEILDLLSLFNMCNNMPL